jgi:hypothetical protein
MRKLQAPLWRTEFQIKFNNEECQGKPFGVFKVTDQIINNLQKNTQPQPMKDQQNTIKEIIRKVKKDKSRLRLDRVYLRYYVLSL